jgi:hypothetical protein
MQTLNQGGLEHLKIATTDVLNGLCLEVAPRAQERLALEPVSEVATSCPPRRDVAGEVAGQNRIVGIAAEVKTQSAPQPRALPRASDADFEAGLWRPRKPEDVHALSSCSGSQGRCLNLVGGEQLPKNAVDTTQSSHSTTPCLSV